MTSAQSFHTASSLRLIDWLSTFICVEGAFMPWDRQAFWVCGDHACAWGGLNLPVWNISLILKQLYKLLFFLASSHHPPSPTLLHWWILSQTIESLEYIYAESANFYPGVSLSWMSFTGRRSVSPVCVQEEKYLDGLHLNKVGKLWHSSDA